MTKKKAFIVYIAIFVSEIIIYLAKKAWIVLLIIKKVSILVKYLDFINIFLKNFNTQLSKYNKINKYIIKLEKSK